VPVGWKGARHGALAAMREGEDRWTTTTARTGGRRRRFEGRRCVRHTGDAPRGVGELGMARGGLPSVGHHRGGSRVAQNSLGSRLGPA
jgi:hypothetical protein